MKLFKSITALLLVVCMLGMLVGNVFAVSTVNGQPQNTKLSWHVLKSPNETKNLKDFNSLLKQAKKANKPVFIDFYADWCGYCTDMDKKTFSNQRVKAKLNGYFLIKINADYNNKLLNKYRIYGLPTSMILDSNGKAIKRHGGYQEPLEFLKWMSG
jgi:thioredoxin 1